MKAVQPFAMLERLTAHQMPCTPRGVEASSMASGMRSRLNVTLMTAGGTVRPVP